jgi:MOSC domain-containing protein YiiM
MGEVADRTVHGGPDKAVHAHDAEDYRWWEDQLGTAFEPGTFGDNLTTSGLRLNDALVGEAVAGRFRSPRGRPAA